MEQSNGNNLLYTEEDIPKCHLQFWGRLVSSDGMPYFDKVRFTKKTVRIDLTSEELGLLLMQ